MEQEKRQDSATNPVELQKIRMLIENLKEQKRRDKKEKRAKKKEKGDRHKKKSKRRRGSTGNSKFFWRA